MSGKKYPDEVAMPKFSLIEERILDYWKENEIFEKSIKIREEENAPDYVFYDGPPFANGLPHYGHILTGYVKDIVPRYFTMKGFRVLRRFGWDCHGLPAEMEMEKEAGIKGKKEIDKYGIDKFNAGCEALVLKYVDEWERFVKRQGRWVEFKNAYKTLDRDYMESVIWAFKSLYDKGLIYERDRVVSYCFRCETPLSNFETRMDDATRPRQDPSVTLRFKLEEKISGKEAYLLVWTTTPWTLPSNLAIAVGDDIDYCGVEHKGSIYIIAEKRFSQYGKIFDSDDAVVWRGKGKDLIGKIYIHLFDYFKGMKNAFKVISGDFVGTEEGTGIVHIAPGFGEDDQRICDENGIDTVCPVDAEAKFTKEVWDYKGIGVFDANKTILKRLKEEGKLVLHDTMEHNYPHCWRCNTPLIYRAISSWYVDVTAVKKELIEVNQQINWIPSHIKDGQFGKWIEGARDWSISRNRYFGAPIPVFKCRGCNKKWVFGSVEEIEEFFGKKVEDLHRPYIDQLERNCPDCGGKVKRVPEVLDCWFESGSMPYAQVHYPFENKEWFEKYFPADFIVEYIAQTRGWFYTLNVLSTALFGKPAFKNVICHGVVLDRQGRKLSKKLNNYPDPMKIFDKYGADAMRWFLVANPILRGGNLMVSEDGEEVMAVLKDVLLPLWNAYYFFTLYANIDSFRAEFSWDSVNPLDKYIVSELKRTAEKVDNAMQGYDIFSATENIKEFIDTLTNWYIRRSRRRFWKSENDEDKTFAFNTLFTVLSSLVNVSAPFLPFLSEYIYMSLTGKLSVHLQSFLDWKVIPHDEDLILRMRTVRRIVSLGHSLRKKNSVRVRQPLSRLMVSGKGVEKSLEFSEIIKEELNVKNVVYVEKPEDLGSPVLKVNLKIAGPKLGAKTQDVIKAGKNGNFELTSDGKAKVAGIELERNEYSVEWLSKGEKDCMSEGNLIVSLDLKMDKALEDEGRARELIRQIQNARSRAGLNVQDRIQLILELPDSWKPAVIEHRELIENETLSCCSFEKAELESGYFSMKENLLGDDVTIFLKRVQRN
ncbi:isoleucine--tRNA ligase [candidate division WOR-3 bacterium]|nr:isoleucine--tRNA ligase [candidate division WOR-3 bacterium]